MSVTLERDTGRTWQEFRRRHFDPAQCTFVLVLIALNRAPLRGLPAGWCIGLVPIAFQKA